MAFIKQILAGSKSLIPLSELKEAKYIPRFYEIDTRVIWNQVKTIPMIQNYFPDSFVHLRRIPPRPFLFSVSSIGSCHNLSIGIQRYDQKSYE